MLTYSKERKQRSKEILAEIERERERGRERGIDRQTSIRVARDKGGRLLELCFEGSWVAKNYKQCDYIAGIWPKFINQWNNLC